MKLEHAQRNPDSFKCATPEETISRIEQGFQRLELKLHYTSPSSQEKYPNCHVCAAQLSNLDIKTGGKGTTPELAKASACAEMAERFSAGLYFNELHSAPGAFEPQNSLSQALDDIRRFTYMPGYQSSPPSGSSFLESAQMILPQTDYSPKAWRENCRSWIAGEVSGQDKTLVPLEFISQISGSNGLAAGNTLAEAIVQGACEIFERYAQLQVIKNKMQVPTIDLSKIPYARVTQAVKSLERQGIKVIFKDFAMNMNLPVVGALFIDKNLISSSNPLLSQGYAMSINAGAALNVEEAMLRCLTEKIQSSHQIHLEQERQDLTTIEHWWLNLFEPLKTSVTIKPSYEQLVRRNFFTGDLEFLLKGPLLSPPDSVSNGDVLRDVHHLIQLCNQLQTKLIIVDHTHPILKFPVVRVIIPGLSDILGYKDQPQDNKVTDYLPFVHFNWAKSLIMEHPKYLDDGWLEDSRLLHNLRQWLLNRMGYNLLFDKEAKSPIGIGGRSIHLLKLLMSICLYIEDYPTLSCCARYLSRSPGPNRRLFDNLYLAALMSSKSTRNIAAKISTKDIYWARPGDRRNPFTEPAKGQEYKTKRNELKNIIASFILSATKTGSSQRISKYIKFNLLRI